VALSASTYITDSVLFVRDKLRANITDPLNRSGSGANWIFTAFPEQNPIYPIIVVRKTGGGETQRLGHQSSAQWCPITIEIRVYSKTVRERDSLAQAVHHYLRGIQLGTNSSTEYELFDFKLNSSVPVDEPGQSGIHSEVMECVYYAILTG
jgi:hypothetical protein